jgi:hypothetical protein
MVVVVANRSTSALEVQKLLTEASASIKTRLGLHEGVGKNSGDSGLIILELVGDTNTSQKLATKLQALAGVNAKLVEIEEP